MGSSRGSILKLPTPEHSQNLTRQLASNYGKCSQTKVVLMHIPKTWKGGENQMKKIIALVMGIAFAFGTAGFVAAQEARAPSPNRGSAPCSFWPNAGMPEWAAAPAEWLADSDRECADPLERPSAIRSDREAARPSPPPPSRRPATARR